MTNKSTEEILKENIQLYENLIEWIGELTKKYNSQESEDHAKSEIAKIQKWKKSAEEQLENLL